MNITLTLTLPEVNVILAVLSQGQYREVATTLHKVQEQAERQVAEARKEPAKEPDQEPAA